MDAGELYYERELLEGVEDGSTSTYSVSTVPSSVVTFAHACMTVGKKPDPAFIQCWGQSKVIRDNARPNSTIVLRDDAYCPTLKSFIDCATKANEVLPPPCVDVTSIYYQMCESEVKQNAWGFGIFLVFILLCGYVILFLQKTPFGALMKKNVLLWRANWVRSILIQLASLTLIGGLVALVKASTGTNTTTMGKLAVPGRFRNMWLEFPQDEFPDEDRIQMFQTLRTFGGLLFVVAFANVVASIAIALANEKATRMKETLRIAGMTDWQFSGSYVLTFAILHLPYCLIVASLTIYGEVIPNQTISEVTFFFFSFVMANVGVASVLTSLFQSTRVVALVAVIVMLVTFLLSITLLTAGEELKMGLCFAPAICLAWGLDYMFESSSLGVGVDLNLLRYPTPMTCSLLMLSWGVVWWIIGWYLEHVLPQQYGIRQNPLFVFPMVRDFFSNLCNKAKTQRNVKTVPDIEEDLGLEIDELTKVYGENIAVDKLSLTIRTGRVLALLGRNGAGKSTTFEMLTGMRPPTSGDIRVMGKSMTEHPQQVRKMLGYVPQTNSIYPDLTVAAHLELMCRLRGTNGFDPRILDDLDMTKKLTTKAGSLSGGQKRKLMLALALVGNTKVLFLDELSSGVDMESRDGLFTILRRFRDGRIIVCTTHFMDEAERLGDEVAILAEGQLKCHGTVAKLTQEYGHEFRVLSSRKNGVEDDAMLKEFAKKFPDISHDLAPGSIIFRIPMQKSVATTILDVVKYIEAPPQSRVARVEAPSLEDVFVQVTGNPEEEVEQVEKEQQQAEKLVRKSTVPWTDSMRAMFRKRLLRMVREKSMWIGLLLVSTLMVIAPLVPGEIRIYTFLMDEYSSTAPDPTAECAVNIGQTNNFSACCLYPTDSSDNETLISEFYTCMETNPQCLPVNATSLCETLVFDFCDSMPWACDMDYCCDFYTNEDSPMYACRTDTDLSSLIPMFDDLCPTRYIATVQGYINSLFQTIVVSIAFTFCLAAVIASTVQEHESANTKLLQFMSGVRWYYYWAASFVVDIIYVLIITFVSIWTYTNYSGLQAIQPELAGYSTALLVTFAFSSIAWAYCMSFYFDLHSKALVFLIIFWTTTGPGIGILTTLLRELEGGWEGTYWDAVDVMDYFLNIFPAYALLTGLVVPRMDYSRYDLEIEYDTEFTTQFVLMRIGYMSVTGVVAMILVLLFEIYPHGIPLPQFLKKTFSRYERRNGFEVFDEDDIQREIDHVESADQDDPIQVVHLTKGYGKDQYYSLDDVSFSVRRGECFSYLGANGAGKSTTLNMLCGELVPTNGTIRVAGFDPVVNRNEARKHMGYCTQFDLLWPRLTVREHLEILARVNGYENVTATAIQLEKKMNLTRFSHTEAARLSGGNKRKLMAAVTLGIGEPQVCMLDEPSSGLDICSARFLWHVINRARKDAGVTVLLTSHSFSEIEALSDRVGILVEGRLRSLGDIHSITARYSTGFRILVNFRQGQTHQPLINGLTKTFGAGGFSIIDSRDDALSFTISDTSSSLFSILQQVYKFPHVQSCSASHSTLDEVFRDWVNRVKDHTQDSIVQIQDVPHRSDQSKV